MNLLRRINLFSLFSVLGALINVPLTAPNMVFSVAYYLDLHGAMALYYWNNSLPSKVVNMFYNVQTTNLTFVGKTWMYSK